MKYSIFLFLTLFLLFSCSKNKSVYWCGDHACINNKEKKTYFKKTMIVEKRELVRQNDEEKTELEIIKQQAGLKNKNKINNKKEIKKQARLEEKRRIREEKELTKQARLEEKRRIREEKELTKQARLEEKEIKKEKKGTPVKESLKAKKTTQRKKVVSNTGVTTPDVSSTDFNELVEKITKKNMFKSFPDINEIQN